MSMQQIGVEAQDIARAVSDRDTLLNIAR